MSQENVELIRALQPDPGVDLAQLFRDDATAAALLEALAPFVWADLECFGGTSIEGVSGSGLNGLRAVWLEWLEPWESYRTEIEELIDAGDQTVVLVRDYGRRKSSDAEVSQRAAAVWTVRDGKVARAEFYADRSQALEAAGLTE
jgi:SnoaL-like domain